MINDQVIKDLGLIGATLIRRDGTLIEGILPDYVDKETFSIMCATVFGGASTAYDELHFKDPELLTIYGDEGNVIMFPNGPRDFYAIISPSGMDPKKIKDEFIEKQK
ncbi:MAG: roadblock/LC7 domain-containing protein [Thermoplasmata archaeon]|nr:roadblock/LC7 domain-containing protein [Thermoplasmata archaeon]